MLAQLLLLILEGGQKKELFRMGTHNLAQRRSHHNPRNPHPAPAAPAPEETPAASAFQCTPSASFSTAFVHSFNNPSSDVEQPGRINDAYNNRLVLDTFEGRFDCSYRFSSSVVGAVVRPQYGYTARRVLPADGPRVDVFGTAQLTLQDAYAYVKFGPEVGASRMVEFAIGAQPAPVGLFAAQSVNNLHNSIPGLFQRQPFELYASKLTLNPSPELSFFLAVALGWDILRVPEGGNGATVLAGASYNPSPGIRVGINGSGGPHNLGTRTLIDVWGRVILGTSILLQANLNFASAPATPGAAASQVFGAQATVGVREGIFRGALTLEDYYDAQNVFGIIPGNNFSAILTAGVVIPFTLGIPLDFGARVEGRFDHQGSLPRVADNTGTYHEIAPAFPCEAGQCADLFTLGVNVFVRTHVDFDSNTGDGFH